MKRTDISVENLENLENDDEELLFDTDLNPTSEMSTHQFQENSECEVDEVIEVTKVGMNAYSSFAIAFNHMRRLTL